MTSRLLTALSVVALVAVLTPAAGAQPDPPEPGQVVHVPGAAGQHAVFLGTAVDPDTGLLVDGYAIFHHQEGHDGGPGNGGDPKSSCFAFLTEQEVKWENPEFWMMNPSNGAELDEEFVFTNLGADLGKWETEAGVEIFKDGTTTDETLVADTESPDTHNEVYFADIDSEGAIAVTFIWGIFRGPPQIQKQLLEWDMVFDDVDFEWSASGEVGKMDFENIATHETGHAAGLGHPHDSCTEETMYRFAEEGETKKSDLHDGDIAGIQELYS